MEYPSLPTDTLYKFIALAGLTLVLLSVTYPVNKAIELEISGIDVLMHAKKLTAESDSLDQKSNALDREAKLLISKKNKGKMTPAEFDLHMSKEAEFSAQNLALKLKLIEVEALVQKEKVQKWWQYVYVAVAIFSFILGMIGMVSGFWLWYTRVQFLQDRKAILDVSRDRRKKLVRGKTVRILNNT